MLNRLRAELEAVGGRDRAILDSVGDGLYGVDAEGRVTFVGAAAAELLGFSKEELLGANSHELFHHSRPDGSRYPLEECPAHLALTEGRSSRGVEEVFWRKDGTKLVVDYTVTPVRQDGTITGAVLVFRDIGARKAAEDALRASERRLKESQRIARLGTWELDLTRNVLTWSEEIYRIFELDPARFGASYEAFLDAIHPDDREMVARVYAESVKNRNEYDIVHRLLMKDGRIKYVREQCRTRYDAQGKPLQSLGTVQDVTDRRHTEEELLSASRYARSLIEASLDPLATISPEGKITDVNRATEQATGIPRAELIGTDFADYFTEPEQARAGSRRVLERGEVRDYPLTLRHRSGRTMRVLYNATVYLNQAGQPQGVFAAARDVTEQHRMEEMLQQAQRLEAIGALAGGVAHDFNNLLTAILGATDLLLEKIPAFDPMRAEASDIKLAAQRAASLTRQLLTFSRRQVVQPRILDLNEIVTGMERMLHRIIGEDVELKAVLGEELRPVRIDPGQLEQVILNLSVNARDAMPRGGRLTIETANVELGEEQVRHHPGAAPGPHVLLAVSDNGCGMSPEVQGRLFEPFFTTKPTGHGTGLGLSTVYGIVKQAGGDIWVYSEPGKGSVFKIYFQPAAPVAADAKEAAVTAVTAAPVARQGTETILLVEDEPHVRSLAARVLRQAGYGVLEAADGTQALAIAADGAARFDLLLTDVVMPRLGGVELAARLRETRPGLRVVFMSGYTERGAAFQDLGEGSTFLQKPFTPALLAHRVRDLLDGPPPRGASDPAGGAAPASTVPA